MYACQHLDGVSTNSGSRDRPMCVNSCQPSQAATRDFEFPVPYWCVLESEVSDLRNPEPEPTLDHKQ